MDRFNAVVAFIRVVDAGSFTRAADSLELPRNSITKLVQFLERELGVQLLNRTTRRVSLTSEGVAYYQRMSRVLDEWREAEADLAVKHARPRGRIRVDMASAMATQIVIPALPEFYARYPDLQLDIGVSDRPSDLLGDQIDCLVRGGKVTDPGLVARHLGDLSLVLCASKSYLARHGVPAHPSDLERDHVVVRYFFAGTGRTQPIVMRARGEEITIHGQYQIAVNDANALVAAGVAGLGIVQTPAAIAQVHIDEGRLAIVLDHWSLEPVPISVVFAPTRHLSARVRLFVDWMVELFDSPLQTRRP